MANEDEDSEVEEEINKPVKTLFQAAIQSLEDVLHFLDSKGHTEQASQACQPRISHLISVSACLKRR